MGGYAPYVWSSFALAGAVLLANWLLARRRYARAAYQIRRRREVRS